MTTSIDFNKPVASDNYLTLLATLRSMFAASTSLLDTSAYTLSNTPSGAKRLNSSTSSLQQFNGSSWVDVPLRAKFDKDGNQIDTTYARTSTLSNYLAKSGGTMSGTLTFSNGKTIADYLPLSGGTLTGALTFSNGKTIANYLPLTGGTMSGSVTFSNGKTISDYLPLSGGTVSGDIVISSSSTYQIQRQGNSGILRIRGGTGGGGYIGLFGEAVGSGYAGWVSITSEDNQGNRSDVELRPDGTFLQDGNRIAVIRSFDSNNFSLSNGLLINYGMIQPTSDDRFTFNFPSPFKSGTTPNIVCSSYALGGFITVPYSVTNTSASVVLRTVDAEAHSQPFFYIAIGLWK